MGELLRSAYAKRLVSLVHARLRPVTVDMHRWSVNLPGACEALGHWTATLEPFIADGTLEPIVVADLDLVNIFGNDEWPSTRKALQRHFPRSLRPTGNTSRTLSPSFPQAPAGAPTLVPSRETFRTLSSALVQGTARAEGPH